MGQGWDTNGAPVGVRVPVSTAVDNATFLDLGGSPYEGTPKPRCDTLLVPLNNGKSIVPLFHLFTDVPVPSRMRTVIIDDINFSNDPRSIMFGEKVGLPFVPVGIYDFTNKLQYTTETDFNGIYDVLMPSTNHISCPTPSGVCATMYRFVANDPGTPGHLNPNYNAGYATHAAGAEGLPGLSTFADLAPTPVGLNVETPGTGLSQVTCPQSAVTPQLFAVSKPYVNGNGSFTIEGTGFGASKGTGSVTLDGTALPTTAWGDGSISVNVPSGTPVGSHQLVVTSANGQHTVNGLTFHVLGTGFNPAVKEVGPGRTYSTIQARLDAALANNGDDLVVVYPGAPDLTNPRNNPRGAYYENLIVASPVKLQGVGPGGFRGSTYVPGTVIDASAYGSDTTVSTDWLTKVGTLTWDGFQTVQDGEGIYLLASQNATTQAGRARQFTSSYKASIDGFDLRGATQNGFPGNVNDLTGAATGLPPTITTQGGAIFANAYVRNLQVTNNVVQNNGSSYGTIRIGTPDLAPPETNQHNENVRIANNRIIQNAGTNLAGGIGLFAGSNGYEVAANDICGNFSLEYGGGISVYGYSPGGKIHDNRIYLNMSNDEGGGIMIAGEMPQTPGALSPGSGAVDIYANQIQSNLSNDDGGGIRFLMAGNYPMNISNNMIVNNVSTHEGGGIGINDAPNVRVFNNTIMKNLTTATAVTSDGTPAPAGLSTSANSDQLQDSLPGGSPLFSNPLLFNNIFWDNRAGTRAGLTVTGLGVAGDASALNHWDLGVADGTGQLAPTSSVLQENGGHPYVASATNSFDNPNVVQTYDVSVSFSTWRQNPAFVDATLVTLEAPPEQMGDYHLSACPSSACNLAAASKAVPPYQQTPTTLAAPGLDFDGQVRPALGGFDAGADEFGAALPAPPTPPAAELYFSTTGNANPPGVTGAADDADLYLWNGTAFSRALDLSAPPYNVASAANLDGYSRVDATHFYASFTDNVTLTGITGPVADEDVVYFNGTSWSMFFDGSANGLTSALFDLDAISLVGNTLYFSTDTVLNPPGFPTFPIGDDADIYRWNGGSSYTRVMDANGSGSLGLPFAANVDGLIWLDSTHFSLSFSADITAPGPVAVQDEDVVTYGAGTWTVSFNGTAAGLVDQNLDLDAISAASGAQPPLPPPPPPTAPWLLFSTLGNVTVPGVAGTADNADIYGWDGSAFTRVVDAAGAGTLRLPGSAQVDGYARIDATHFYLSFATTTSVPGLGAVADEDVVRYDAGTWSMFFDGSAHGLAAVDLGAISVDGTTLYFTTNSAAVPPGAGPPGSGDNADVYRWDGASSYTRVVDATEQPYGLPDTGAAAGANNPNADGLVWVGPDHFFVSFSNAKTNVPGLGAVQDEDVLEYDAGDWSVFFDGTSHGLTVGGLDVDAFDVS